MKTLVAGGKGVNRLVVFLVRPTNYDDRGYPRRFWRGVLPSNSLAAMYSLTQQALASEVVSVAKYHIEVFDDGVWGQRVDDPIGLVRRFTDGQTKVVVGLVGVQTNQFPRARDLAYKFRKAGATVVIGGFHVSGSISTMFDGIGADDEKRKDVPCPHIMPPEVQKLMADGIIVCHGEAEKVWVQILSDIVAGRPQLLYRGGKPSLENAPMPEYPNHYFDDFATEMYTLDTNRGCPFACNFCTIINVQGRVQRFRDPKAITEMVRQICDQKGSFSGFFTDDNFARNPLRDAILDGLAKLRQQDYKIGFMVEADLASFQLPGFIPKLAAAGCSQVFLGLESLNQAVLKDARKHQNQVTNFPKMIDALHQNGIGVHAAFIIGWPVETRESILASIEELKRLGVDQTSLFILTPLPGSELHIRMYCTGVPMDLDFNDYDSFHLVNNHPNLSRQDLRQLMYKCFREFYRSKQMIAALKRLPPERFWGMLRNYFWYRNSALGEGTHPMMAGFWSKRRRCERRPELPRESLLTFWSKEAWFRLKYIGHCFREFYIFQHVYFEVRLQGEIGEQMADGMTKARSWYRHIFARPSRQWLNEFWIRYGQQKWALLWKPHWHIRTLPYATAEVIYTSYWVVVLWWNLKTMAV